jgi:hypothetical protein
MRATSCPLSRPATRRARSELLWVPSKCSERRQRVGSLRLRSREILYLVSKTLLEREECVISMKRALVEGWGQFLSQFSWDWFLTLTFREPVGSFRAHRLFGYFVRDIEKAAGVPIFWFRADEIGTHLGRFHMHALMGNVGNLRRMTWVDRWNDLAGYARILPFRADRGAAFYCAKYIAKQSGDWEMSDNLAAFNQYQPVLALEGMAKPKLTLPERQQVGAAVNRQPKKLAAQLPLPTGLSSPLPKPDAVIPKIYRAEVTRGRGRFRNFFPTNE